jgi:hypothetical protein
MDRQRHVEHQRHGQIEAGLLERRAHEALEQIPPARAKHLPVQNDEPDVDEHHLDDGRGDREHEVDQELPVLEEGRTSLLAIAITRAATLERSPS